MHIELKRAVEMAFGKQISTNGDCVQLSMLLEHIGYNVSAQTLRRFFNLIAYNGSYSNYTRKALEAFVKNQEDNRALLTPAILIEELLDVELEQYPNLSFGFVNDRLAQRLVEDPILLIQLQNKLMRYPAAQKYFLEHHPLRDYIRSNYKNYFAEYLKFKSTNEAKIFAYGFLYIGEFLGNNTRGMEKHFQEIQKVPLTKEVYHIPAARKFGVPLIHYSISKDTNKLKATYDDMWQHRPNYYEAAKSSACSFDYMIIEHLFLIKKFEEIIEINKTAQKQIFNDFTPTSRQVSHQLIYDLMVGYAEYITGESSKILLAIENYDENKISFGWKKYSKLIYNLSKYKIYEDSKQSIEKEIKKLIIETNFIHFNSWMDE